MKVKLFMLTFTVVCSPSFCFSPGNVFFHANGVLAVEHGSSLVSGEMA
ncbi:MAG: hypothetical protein ACE5JA_06250 [bacterium]